MEDKIVYGIGEPFPSYLNISECSLVCIERAEEDFNNLMQNIGINELTKVNESGQIFLYEAFDIKQVVESVVEWFKKRFEDIKAMFQKAMDFISKKIKAFNEKIELKTFHNLVTAARIKDLKNLGKAYDFSAIGSGVSDKSWSYISGYRMTLYSKLLTGDKDTKTEELVSDAKKILNKKLTGEEADVTVKKLKEIMKGNEFEVTADWVNSNFKELAHSVSDFSAAKKELQSYYKMVKKSFDDAIKEVKTKMKADKELTNFKPLISGLKYGAAVATNYSAASIGSLNDKLFRNMKIMIKIFTASKKKSESEAKNESAYFGGSIQTEISSLFAF